MCWEEGGGEKEKKKREREKEGIFYLMGMMSLNRLRVRMCTRVSVIN